MLILLLLSAQAAPVGGAIATPEVGRLRLSLNGQVGSTSLVDPECGANQNCDASWGTGVLDGGLEVVLLRGVSVRVGGGALASRISEANYRGYGSEWYAGGRAGLPVLPADWWFVVDGQVRLTNAQGGRVDGGGRESEQSRLGWLTAMLAKGEPEDGGSLWFGAQMPLMWDQHVYPLGKSDGEPILDLGLKPAWLGSALAGASLTSEPIGVPWKMTVRLEMAVEGQVGLDNRFLLSFGAWF